ncbi:unnamed protein product [Acanthosepion pharaonis]|uniref:Uncharacterized protein n=1 Tax=Acanthosepion pharaonis TaxID=158019 RepID=A0A812CSW5_ACAPH|nr:unnamed protein product [Sepia pharaonis]
MQTTGNSWLWTSLHNTEPFITDNNNRNTDPERWPSCDSTPPPASCQFSSVSFFFLFLFRFSRYDCSSDAFSFTQFLFPSLSLSLFSSYSFPLARFLSLSLSLFSCYLPPLIQSPSHSFFFLLFLFRFSLVFLPPLIFFSFIFLLFLYRFSLVILPPLILSPSQRFCFIFIPLLTPPLNIFAFHSSPLSFFFSCIPSSSYPFFLTVFFSSSFPISFEFYMLSFLLFFFLPQIVSFPSSILYISCLLPFFSSLSFTLFLFHSHSPSLWLFLDIFPTQLILFVVSLHFSLDGPFHSLSLPRFSLYLSFPYSFSFIRFSFPSPSSVFFLLIIIFFFNATVPFSFSFTFAFFLLSFLLLFFHLHSFILLLFLFRFSLFFFPFINFSLSHSFLLILFLLLFSFFFFFLCSFLLVILSYSPRSHRPLLPFLS